MVAVDASRTDVLRQGQRDLFAIRNALPRRLVQSSQAAYGSDPSGSRDVDWEGCCERITRCGGAPRSLVRGSACPRGGYCRFLAGFLAGARLALLRAAVLLAAFLAGTRLGLLRAGAFFFFAAFGAASLATAWPDTGSVTPSPLPRSSSMSRNPS